MSGYTKVFESIIHSTIWREQNHIRLVWITMLAMKDEDGVVEASVPGLMDAARVTRDEVEDALAHLSAPDPDSRNPAHEGRRIAEVDGGWYLFNHEYYKNKMSKEEKAERKRELGRIRQQNFRDKRNTNVTESNAPSRTITPDNAKPPIRSDHTRSDQNKDKTKNVSDFDSFWNLYPRRKAKLDALKAWKQTAKTRPTIDDLLRAIRTQLRDPQWQKGIIPLPASWLRGERWNDEPEKGSGGHTVGRLQPKEFPPDPIDDEPPATPEQIADITGSGGVAAIEAREAEREKTKQLTDVGEEGEDHEQ